MPSESESAVPRNDRPSAAAANAAAPSSKSRSRGFVVVAAAAAATAALSFRYKAAAIRDNDIAQQKYKAPNGYVSVDRSGGGI